MVTTLAIAGLVCNAALAVVGYLFYKRLSLRIEVLGQSENPYQTRYDPPVHDEYLTPDIPETDFVGAWAHEMAQAGVRVSDHEIELQRRMRIEAGL